MAKRKWTEEQKTIYKTLYAEN